MIHYAEIEVRLMKVITNKLIVQSCVFVCFNIYSLIWPSLFIGWVAVSAKTSVLV